MSDPTLSASDHVAEGSRRSWAVFTGLHPITRLVIAGGLIHLIGDLLMGLSGVLRNVSQGLPWQGLPIETLAGILTSIGYSLTYFGTAATVEFLFRIWREVVLMRQQREAADR